MINSKQIILLICLFSNLLNYAQNPKSAIETLDKLIAQKEYAKANIVLKNSIAKLTTKKDYYQLTDMIFYVGKLELEKSHNTTLATKVVTNFMNSIAAKTDSIKVRRQIEMESASYYELIGDSQKAYDANKKALDLTKKWSAATGEDFGLIENNLSILADRTGNLAAALAHIRKARRYFELYPKTQKKNLYNVYNSMGANMWNMSKIDSALYYFKKSETVLNTLEKTPRNIYKQAMLQNNIAAIYSTQGNLNAALTAMKTTINCLNSFLKSDIPDNKRAAATEFLYSAIENYAGIYKSMGDYQKTLELLLYANREKQRYFDAENPEIFKSKILLGQINYELKDYKKANFYLNNGIKQIEKTSGDNYLWNADAHYTMALINDAVGKTDNATQNFDKSERLYNLALEGSYDEMYLDFIVKASHFYARNNQKDKAIKMAKKAYEYVKENQGITTSFEIQQTLNLAELYYELGDYQLALHQSKKTLELLTKSLPTQKNIQNSTVIYKYKPLAILYKVKSEYQLESKKEVSFLKQHFKELNLAIAIIEQQKTLLNGDTNISILIEDNTEVFEFAKKIALQLYQATKDKSYLEKMIGLNESVLYNKIRARLNSRSAMAYHDVPQKILNQEQKIQAALQKSLQNSDDMKEYFKLENDWNNYLKMLQLKYPKYYELRFASISKSAANITENLPKNVTVVRYTTIDNQLYGIVLAKEKATIFKINQVKVADNIKKLQQDNLLFENQFEVLHDLYLKLWKPLEKDIKTKDVIIVPEGDLFNLSFEMLTPNLAKSYQELTRNSLLAKYVISYNYSLFLIDKNSKTIDYAANFIAFVPEFNDKMKTDYKIAINDSLNFDKTYLTLLPQPFTKTLAEKATRIFRGTSFLNENSTEKIFKNSAKEHKIIHIGTHAESNNISPELSRLVFAKSLDSTNTDDNFLYTYEIYNINLASNLAILTACETGKPTYQAGEGMISLAHAFNYAGSESILTSLWKIDEQSSAEIITLFYENIKKGWPKNRALRQAKLDYMATAKGRTINPQYWAGLVLIGDTSPIVLQSSFTFTYWVLALIIIALVVAFIKCKIKNKHQSS